MQALVLAQQVKPQLVLLDVQMPRMDGIETTRCLRQRDHHLRIVVMSCYEQNRSQALAAGADAFVTKDSGSAAIRDTISRLFRIDGDFHDDIRP